MPRKSPSARRPGRRTLRGLPNPTPSVAAGSSAAERLDNLKIDVFKVGLLAVGGGAVLGGIFFAKNRIEQGALVRNQEKATAEVTTLFSPAYYADRLRAAFNPSGSSWLRTWDTTDVTGVMNVARALTSQAQLLLVATAFRALTSRNLTDDLRDELSATEYQQFWAIISRYPKK